ncbi:MAG: hypothetical protein VB034_02510 [Eubacteriales bacterium]|nr:hypothetical protein [Eubacteriales bacterium]
MEKIIKICGQDVGFKAPASLPVRYYNATGRDLFVDLQTLADGTDQAPAKAKKSKKKEELEYRLNRDWNTMVLYGIAHAMARAYDDSVNPNLEDWIDSFESFPIFEVFGELRELLSASLQTSKK